MGGGCAAAPFFTSEHAAATGGWGTAGSVRACRGQPLGHPERASPRDQRVRHRSAAHAARVRAPTAPQQALLQSTLDYSLPVFEAFASKVAGVDSQVGGGPAAAKVHAAVGAQLRHREGCPRSGPGGPWDKGGCPASSLALACPGAFLALHPLPPASVVAAALNHRRGPVPPCPVLPNPLPPHPLLLPHVPAPAAAWQVCGLAVAPPAPPRDRPVPHAAQLRDTAAHACRAPRARRAAAAHVRLGGRAR
jgi:hypothetical protein